jgi:DUF438 domain-containing protein
MSEALPGATLAAILNSLPLDITFIDRNNVIRYFNDYRIFKRTPEILGTDVRDCHSPASLEAVDKVIDDLKSGRCDAVEFKPTKNGRPVRVRYIAVRGDDGEYLGLAELCRWADE